MVAVKLSSFLNVKDKNNVLVSSWAEDRGKAGFAWCKHCCTDVKFSAGSNELTKHSMRKKHVDATPKQNALKQISINEALSSSQEKDQKEVEEKERTRNFEISLARSLSNHNISAQFVECLQSQLKEFCNDSVVVQKMKLCRKKCEVMMREGIATTYREETIKMLQECDAFSVGFDESEVNKTSELEIVVRISLPWGIALRHYRTLDLESGKASNIANDLLSQFAEDGIDYKKKIITAMTDGCNTMQGNKGGVKKILSDEIPEFFDPGSCNDHHLGNAMKHAVTACDPDIEQALVHVYMDIGGAKGRGLKRMKAFEKVCKEIGLSPIPIKRFCSTRFRAIRPCIKPVLHNWNGLYKYYSGLKKPTPRQKLLQDYFVSREQQSYLNMNFIYSATREIDEAIDHFEKRTSLVYGAREKMEKILRSSILKFHMETAVKELDDEDGNTVKKSGAQLLKFDVDDSTTKLRNRKIFIGEEAKRFIAAMSLDPKSPQLGKFFERVFAFHRTVTLKYIHYFSTGLNCTELDYMSALNPKKFNGMSTPHYIKYLAKKFTKVVKNIEPVEGQDRLFEEIDDYTVDDEVKELSCLEFEEFWLQVAKLTENVWQKYKILPRFALAFGTLFNSNSESERAFSVQTDIHRNPKRNLMIQHTFDGHMQIHYGVEGKESRELCTTCIKHKNASSAEVKSTPTPHCHCSVAPIGEKMKQNCKRMWELNKNRVELNSIAAEVDKEKEEASKAEFTKRTLNFVTGLKTRSTFYTPDLMSPVFTVELNDETADVAASKKKKNVSTKVGKVQAGSSGNDQASKETSSSSKNSSSKKQSKNSSKKDSGINKQSTGEGSNSNKRKGQCPDGEKSVSPKKMKKAAPKEVAISLFNK